MYYDYDLLKHLEFEFVRIYRAIIVSSRDSTCIN